MGEQETTFYEKLQNCTALDLRDNRGKIHNLEFVLLGLVLSLLRKRDGCLSSVHRSMQNKNVELCKFLGINIQPVVSRSHLPLVLQKVNLFVFEDLIFKEYGIQLNATEQAWFSGDGKELRGSIESGDKRGEAVVLLVRQDDGAVLGQSYYSGKKESERPCLRQLLLKTGAVHQKCTLDALHLCPKTTQPIAQANGVFMIGLKGNQKDLLADMEKDASFLKPIGEMREIDKGHGRLEQRMYSHYDVSWEYFDPRWTGSDFRSLIKVERNRMDLKSGKKQSETAYFISNAEAVAEQSEEYFGAIRGHWSVEVNNHIRDVTFKEDQLKTKKKLITRAFAGLRTLAISILNRLRPANMVAQLEFFQDDFGALLHWLRKLNFL